MTKVTAEILLKEINNAVEVGNFVLSNEDADFIEDVTGQLDYKGYLYRKQRARIDFIHSMLGG